MWLELATLTEPEAVESVSEAFTRWGQGVALEQTVDSSGDGDIVDARADTPVLVKTYLPLMDPTAADRRQHIEKAVWALGRLRQVGPLQVRTLREEDWANAWKAHFPVHRVGRRTVIVPSWRADEYQQRPGDLVLLLDPGMAFGTGLHPTTRLCLAALEAHVQPGSRVLDLGAGSGILAIAAARLGARRVDAVEIDPVAAHVCRDNVARNGIADRVRVHEGSADVLPMRPAADLVVANITIRVLLELHPEIARRARPGATAIFSGVLADRAPELAATLTHAGWGHRQTHQEGDWVAIIAATPS